MAPPSAAERLKLFGTLHGFHHDIHSPSTEAQRLFDQVGIWVRKSVRKKRDAATAAQHQSWQSIQQLIGQPWDHTRDFLLETDLQGLLLAWDFNQPEAEAAFRLALQADANASMAQWGIQYSIGPGANR